MKGLKKYEKIKDLGEGAQGTVILSRDKVLGRRVAIKSLHSSLTSDSLHVKRFEQEAKTLAGLEHPSIVTVYEYIANNSGCHLMMEYFEGNPLDLYIRNVTGPIAEDAAIDIYIKILDAMNYIHKKKIIHRDIKPSNIMINDNSEIRLLDFGIAKNTENDPTLTKVGASAGYTPMYMSPEHCNGQPITKYSDIYSLGVTLWQMVTGKPPYEGFTQGQIYLKVANEPLPSIQSVYPNISLKMNAIIQKATHKNPKERFKSCADFKKELVLLKEHIKNLPTDFLYAITVNITNGIEADISLNNEHHYGFEFSKSFDVSNDDSILLMIEKSGYKKIKQKILLTKDETLSFKLEKQKSPFLSVITGFKDSLITYSKNVLPNLGKLFIYFKLVSIWAFDSVQLKLKKNNLKAVKLVEAKNNKTKKAINKTSKTIKPHKNEYAVYLIFLILFFVALFSFIKVDDGFEVSNELPIVNFETSPFEGLESKKEVIIAVRLSKTTNSIVKIPLIISGTADKNDYEILTDTIIIDANRRLGNIKLNVINDSIIESRESIIIDFGIPENALLGITGNSEIGDIVKRKRSFKIQQTFTYTIIDDDIGNSESPKDPVIQKKVPNKPKFIKRGTLAGAEWCFDNNRYQYYHDGKGGTYKEIIKRNSPKCGFKPATQTASTNSNQNWKTAAKTSMGYFSDDINGKYFVTYIVVNKDITMKVYDITNGILINSFNFKGTIWNLYYGNDMLYTNRYFGLDYKHHQIDILQGKSKSKFKSRKYLGNGNEIEVKIHTKN
ncbi:serine/threonine protein kinase [Flavobacteriaceae bacterium]|nr:serine/threonine protein kinase [Flavobacteriaceae bacterium]